MPLTALQKKVLEVLARNRSQASHFAGGTVLHADEGSARYSRDFDIFHEAENEVARASDLDIKSLRNAGFDVQPLAGDWKAPCSFRRARLNHEGEALEIDWAVDSAFRFFPIVEDAAMGYRLHLFDAATNKALALASRSAVRDLVDIVELDRVFPLEAIVWAACGKDVGYSPLLLIEMMRRFSRIDPAELKLLSSKSIEPLALKKEWIFISARAVDEINRLADARPDLPIGVAFVDDAGNCGWPGQNSNLTVHRPSLYGCWPKVHVAPQT